jgi:hypothetical protein
MKWKPFQQDGNIYDLSHLHPFELELIQPAKGNDPERIYNFNVAFSLHCFTKAVKEGDNPAFEYRDNREIRTFCFERYRLSFHLPDIIREIHTKRCNHSGKDNFFIVELMTDEGERVEYEIYFNVTKPTSKGAPMRLYVQSAYIRNKGSKPYRRKTKKIHFFVIAYNRKVGKPIKTPA